MKKLTKIEEKNLVDSYCDLSEEIKNLEIDKKSLNEKFIEINEGTGQIDFFGTLNNVNVNQPENCNFNLDNLLFSCIDKIEKNKPNMNSDEKLLHVIFMVKNLVKIDLTETKKEFGTNYIESFGKIPASKRLLIKKHK